MRMSITLCSYRPITFFTWWNSWHFDRWKMASHFNSPSIIKIFPYVCLDCSLLLWVDSHCAFSNPFNSSYAPLSLNNTLFAFAIYRSRLLVHHCLWEHFSVSFGHYHSLLFFTYSLIFKFFTLSYTFYGYKSTQQNLCYTSNPFLYPDKFRSWPMVVRLEDPLDFLQHLYFMFLWSYFRLRSSKLLSSNNWIVSKYILCIIFRDQIILINLNEVKGQSYKWVI